MVPNGSSASAANRIFRGALEPDDTFLFEPNYPITLSTTGDNISVFNEGSAYGGTATNSITVLVLGDKEA